MCVGCIPLCPLLSRSLDGSTDSSAASSTGGVSPASVAIADIVHKVINYCGDSKT